MNEFKYLACARPSCQCPQIETYRTVDGEVRVMISDDFGGVISVSVEEMRLLATKFLDEYYNE